MNERAIGINDGGQIVGTYEDENREYRRQGFLYDAGVFTTLDVPDAFVSQAHHINDRGQIVGFYADSSGTFRGLVATRTTR